MADWWTQNAPNNLQNGGQQLYAGQPSGPLIQPTLPQGGNANGAAPGQGGNGAAPTVQPNQVTGQGVGGGGQDYAAIIANLQKQFPPTPEGFKQLLSALNAQGIPAMAASHGGGTLASDDKIVLPNGTYYDIRTDNGWTAPGTPLHWDPSVPVFNAQGQSQNYNDFLKDQGLPTFQFTPTAADGMGGTQGNGAGDPSNLGGYGPLLQPYDKTFQAPSGTDDPGFAFALKNGIEALQHSQAAGGKLLTGGAMKDLASYVTGASLQDYAGAFNRAKTTFDTNYNVSRNNKLDPFNMLSSLTGTGLNAAESANASNTNYGNSTVDLTTGQGNVNANQTAGNYNAWSGVPANLADLANTAFDAYRRRKNAGVVPPPNYAETPPDQRG